MEELPDLSLLVARPRGGGGGGGGGGGDLVFQGGFIGLPASALSSFCLFSNITQNEPRKTQANQVPATSHSKPFPVSPFNSDLS